MEQKKRVCDISLYDFIEKLQLCFIKVGNSIQPVICVWSNKAKNGMRIAILLFLFLYMQIMSISNRYMNVNFFKYHMYVAVIALIFLSIFSLEKPLCKLNWNNRFVKLWFTFWILAVISEFIVPKRYAYQGIIMIFVMAFFFFVWNNMENREEIVMNFQKALELWFWINVPLCYLFRPFEETMRYTGMSKNPNIWAMYLVFVLAAFLNEAESSFRTNNGKKKIRGICSLAAVGMGLDFIIKTGSSSGLIPAVLIIGLWGIRQLWWLRSFSRKWLKVCCLTVGLFVVISGSRINDWGLKTIANHTGSSIGSEEEEEFGSLENFRCHPFTLKAEASDGLKDNRVINKLFKSTSLEEFTTGRNLFWIGYLRETNLWGHEFAPLLWGAKRSAHNGVIAILYRYGILAVLPYILLIGYYMKYSLVYKRQSAKGTDISYFIKAISISVFILLMMENVEFPFYYHSWYAFYLVMGMYFGNEVLGEEKADL